MRNARGLSPEQRIWNMHLLYGCPYKDAATWVLRRLPANLRAYWMWEHYYNVIEGR